MTHLDKSYNECSDLSILAAKNDKNANFLQKIMSRRYTEPIKFCFFIQKGVGYAEQQS